MGSFGPFPRHIIPVDGGANCTDGGDLDFVTLREGGTWLLVMADRYLRSHYPP
jgi:hypothetical protein